MKLFSRVLAASAFSLPAGWIRSTMRLLPLVLLFPLSLTEVAAQTSENPSRASAGVEGRWEGRIGPSFRLLLEITKTQDSLYFATLTSIDQGGEQLPIDRMEVNGDSVRLEISSLGASYVGALSPDRSRLIGTRTEDGRPVPLEFTRAAPRAPAQPAANVTSLFGVAADIHVPVPPVPFVSAGRRHLAYEIHLRNHSGAGMLLTGVEVLDGTTSLARWEGAELHRIISQRRPSTGDNRAIAPGGWAVVFVWVTTDSSAPRPLTLRHRVKVGDEAIEGTVRVASVNPLKLGPPLRGGDWLAANGPANDGGHRRALVPIGGQAFIAQRYATDWAKLGPNGRPVQGDPKLNGSYFGYGAEVIAAADGIIQSVQDGIPENEPGTGTLRAESEGATLRAVPMTLETIPGNYVIQSVAEGRYAFYGHLIPGSLLVKPGDRVRRG